MCFNGLSLWKHLTEQMFHNWLQLRTNATAIKVNFIDIINIYLRKEFRTQDLQDGVTVLMNRIKSLGIDY